MPAASPIIACTTCDTALQAQIYDEHFWIRLLAILPPLLVGGLLVAWAVGRLTQRIEARRRGSRQRLSPVIGAGTLIGLGMGGFVDGIVLHQLLQWHQMVSNHVPPETLQAKNLNMFWDGVFHVGAWTLTAIGILWLWALVGRTDIHRSTLGLLSAMWFGWGVFNILDSIANHYLFRFHNVRELVANPDHWNLGFLIFALVQVVTGATLLQRTLSKRPARTA